MPATDTVYGAQTAVVGRETKFLNQYVGYFASPEGDVPISVVSSSMIEAAKLLSMPGMIAAESVEPVTIKYAKSKVGVMVPIRQISFDVSIDPVDAKTAGAMATPAHFDVENGEEVIFTATEPFGFQFDGWYREGETVPLSTDKIAKIEVYEQNRSYVKYLARFTANYTTRSGRYLDIQRGTMWDISFDPYGVYLGRIALNPDDIAPYWGGITKLELAGSVGPDGSSAIANTIEVQADTTVVQTTAFGFTGTFVYTPIGITITMASVGEGDNVFGFVAGDNIPLKFIM
jgi:hypothetical protein